MLTVHLKFKITRFTKGLVFQLLEFDAPFWADMLTHLTGGTTYTASNGLVITVGASTSSITNVITNAMTLGNGTLNMAPLTTITDVIRDAQYAKIVAALKELVLFVLNNGTLPHTCHYCFNFNNFDVDGHFCKWIDEVTDDWDIDVHFCTNFNVLHESQGVYEVFEL